MTTVNLRDEDLAEIARAKKRICAFSNRFRETEARCKKPFFPEDPCDVKPDDLRQWPGWRSPQVGYEQCILENSMAKPPESEENDGAKAVAADENKCTSPHHAPAFAGGLQFPSSTDRGAVTRPECECKCTGGGGGRGGRGEEMFLILIGGNGKQKTKSDEGEGKKAPDECEELAKSASCPSRDMGVGRRIIYDKKNGMIPGYAGHVPAMGTCSFGGNWGDETRKVLKRTFSDPKLKLKHGNL